MINLRVVTYLIIGVGLTIGFVLLRDTTWVGNEQLHTLMEALATLLALVVGALSLVRFYTKKNNMFLFIGTGFLGTAFLDGYHAIVTSAYFKPFMLSDNISLIPWSWVASREFLSIFMLLSFLVWRRETQQANRAPISELNVYLFSIIFTLASFLFFTFVPLPRAYYPEFVFHRPEELLPALFFGLALIGYLHKGYWRHNAFEHWLVISLIIGFTSQAVFMSFSGSLFDFEFDAAHTLKKVSYICVLTGLLYNMFHVYTKAEEANRAKSDFLNIMSHELRTPLTVILGYTPILSNPKNLPSVKHMMTALENKHSSHQETTENIEAVLTEISKYIKKMETSGSHLLMLINDMLDLSKIEAGQMEIHLQHVCANSTIRSIIEQFRQIATDKDITISLRETQEIVLADEIRLKQILINLISNALKYTDQGSISISTMRKGELLEFSIADTGCGVPECDHQTVFERFKQVDETASRKAGGTGLGLAITKRLIELQGGQITISSTLGHGSTFMFTIPLAPVTQYTI